MSAGGSQFWLGYQSEVSPQQEAAREPRSKGSIDRLTTATCWRNLVPTFEDRGLSRGKRNGSPTVVKLSFLDRSRYFFFQVAPIYPHEVEWTPFQKIW
jgi:hypothetical protein